MFVISEYNHLIIFCLQATRPPLAISRYPRNLPPPREYILDPPLVGAEDIENCVVLMVQHNVVHANTLLDTTLGYLN